MNWFFIILGIVFFICWICCLIFPCKCIIIYIKEVCWNTWSRTIHNRISEDTIENLDHINLGKIVTQLVWSWYFGSVCIALTLLFLGFGFDLIKI